MDDGGRLAARFFPNADKGAYYSHRDFAVHFPSDSMDPGRIGDAGYRQEWLLARLPTLVHEYQHSMDHLGTVVGRTLLDRLAAAIAGVEKKLAGDVAGLPDLVALHDAELRFSRTRYFTEVNPTYRPPRGGRPQWGWKSSIGVAFDQFGRTNEADPLFFVRFRDVDQDLFVSRQPITAASLFETRSVYVELDHDSRLVAERLLQDPRAAIAFNERQMEMFYDHTLTRYSAPAHVVSSRCGDGDSLAAYRAAALVAGVALNISPTLQFTPRLPPSIRDLPAQERCQRLLHLRDPGFLFIVIVLSAPKLIQDVFEWLKGALEEAGFPALETILDAAQEYLSVPPAATSSKFAPIHASVAAAGAESFRRLRPSIGLLDFDVMQKVGTEEGPSVLPNVLLAQNLLGPLGSPVLTRDLQVEVANMAGILDRHMSEFLAACR
jgi:hypothetical protein